MLPYKQCVDLNSNALPLKPCTLQERLEREYNLDLVTTAPTVVYKCLVSDGSEVTVNSPADLPEATKRDSISEPYVRCGGKTPLLYTAWRQEAEWAWAGSAS